jgi:hypothetical protein
VLDTLVASPTLHAGGNENVYSSVRFGRKPEAFNLLDLHFRRVNAVLWGTRIAGWLWLLEIWSPEPGLNQRHPVYKNSDELQIKEHSVFGVTSSHMKTTEKTTLQIFAA